MSNIIHERHELWFLERMEFQGKVSKARRVDSLERGQWATK
jgi:hypothetical protein